MKSSKSGKPPKSKKSFKNHRNPQKSLKILKKSANPQKIYEVLRIQVDRLMRIVVALVLTVVR